MDLEGGASPEMKGFRMLSMYERLSQGEVLNKKSEAAYYGVNEKSIQRDIEHLRLYLMERYPQDEESTIEYDRHQDGYVLRKGSQQWLSREEVLWLARILLESRSLPPQEMRALLDKLTAQCTPRERKRIAEIVRNETFHYMPLQHGRVLVTMVWDLSQAYREQQVVEIDYLRVGSTQGRKRRVYPQGVLFSEYYFYLLAYIEGQPYDFPTIYRLDRIQHYEVTQAHFDVNYAKRFQEGEFRKRIQFMQSGQLMKVTFRFWGESLEAILDRLPTATIMKRGDTGTILQAETFGRGIKMWFLSQAQYLEVLEPVEFREEMRRTAKAIMDSYE